MADVSIRVLAGDERVTVLHALAAYSLDPSPPLPELEGWRQMIGPRAGVTYVAAFEDGEPASVAASTAMRHNARGRVFDAGGVWGVATGPAFRRKGYCRRVIGRLLEVGREAGQAFSTLYPFRESFYERLGYVTMPLPRKAFFSPAGLAPLLKVDLPGKVTLGLIGERYDEYRAYLAEMLETAHGTAIFAQPDYGAAGRNRSWVAQAVVDGRVEGVMLYALKGEEETKYQFQAIRFYYSSMRARYLLLQWIARHVDQAERVEMWLAPGEQPEMWLADIGVKVETALRAPMGRVTDVAAIGGMQVGPGEVAARISDPLCPWNEGAWRFVSDGGALLVERTQEAASELTIQGLSALVYGAHEPESFALRGWGDAPPEVVAALRAMFPPRIPHLHERF
jgi:predicted acetyltransferase